MYRTSLIYLILFKYSLSHLGSNVLCTLQHKVMFNNHAHNGINNPVHIPSTLLHTHNSSMGIQGTLETNHPQVLLILHLLTQWLFLCHQLVSQCVLKLCYYHKLVCVVLQRHLFHNHILLLILLLLELPHIQQDQALLPLSLLSSHPINQLLKLPQ